MKWQWLWWAIPLLVLALVLGSWFFTSHFSDDDDIGETGSRHDWSNPSAPKIIKSKEITVFNYEFNSESLVYNDKRVPYSYCYFTMIRQDDEALCKVSGNSSTIEGFFNLEFKVPLSALDDVQAIIDKHDLAQVNGTYKKTDGLPPNLGAALLVEYASEEKISASDNNWGVIGDQASLDFYILFSELSREAGYDFIYSKEEIENFQENIEGIWKDWDKTLTIEFYSNIVKTFQDQELLEFTSYTIKDDKLYNSHHEDGYFVPYIFLEWREGLIIGVDEEGEETVFYFTEESEEED